MEINFTASQYYALDDIIFRDVYKPIIDYLYNLIIDRNIKASINRFRNELLLPEICNPNYIGFNIRYSTQDELKKTYMRHSPV